MKKSYEYPADFEDDRKMACHTYMESNEQQLDETRYEVINSLMSVCQVIGLQILRKKGVDHSLEQAANYLGEAQSLIGDVIKHINEDYEK